MTTPVSKTDWFDELDDIDLDVIDANAVYPITYPRPGVGEVLATIVVLVATGVLIAVGVWAVGGGF
jgi:hypothetical protein